MAKIRNHKERVKVAKASYAANNEGLKLSRSDLEAYVETFLIEDIRDFHKTQMNKLNDGTDLTITDEKLKNFAIARHARVAQVFNEISDLCWYLIHFGRYSDVWSIIPEYQLYRLANAASNKKLNEMMKVSTSILRRVHNEALELEREMGIHTEDIADIEATDDNYAKVYNISLPTKDEINALVDSVNSLFVDTKATSDNRKPNLN